MCLAVSGKERKLRNMLKLETVKLRTEARGMVCVLNDLIDLSPCDINQFVTF